MGDMDSRIRRAMEQSAAAEAASLLARLRSTAAHNQLALGDKDRLEAGHRGRLLDISRASHELKSDPEPKGLGTRKP
jgi:hypothetical protein